MLQIMITKSGTGKEPFTVDYLRAHGHLKDLSFISFEHCLFMVKGGSPPDEWDTLYMEPGIMKHVLHTWREDGVPGDSPLIISESGIAPGRSSKGLPGRHGPGYLGTRRVRHVLRTGWYGVLQAAIQ
jgi:hypothetical protein